MLELGDGQKLMDDLWETTPTKLVMSVSFKQEFFKPRGASPVRYDNRRSYHRYYMRGKAILRRGDQQIGTFTKDVSRQGVAFLSPVALMPKERVKLRVPATELDLEVTRCRRLEAACFECGGKFT